MARAEKAEADCLAATEAQEAALKECESLGVQVTGGGRGGGRGRNRAQEAALKECEACRLVRGGGRGSAPFVGAQAERQPG